MPRIEIDRAACIGSGQCEFIAPEVFRVDDDGQARVTGQGAADDALVETAMDGCPTGAIRFAG